LVPLKPCAITISGRGPSKPSGRYSQPAHQSSPEWKVISVRIGFSPGFGVSAPQSVTTLT
jgi:hypothetical protein